VACDYWQIFRAESPDSKSNAPKMSSKKEKTNKKTKQKKLNQIFINKDIYLICLEQDFTARNT